MAGQTRGNPPGWLPAGFTGTSSFSGDDGHGIAQNAAAGQAEPSLARLRFLARRLHRLGPKPLFHFLHKIERGAPLRPHLEAYARLPADFIKANGGDEFERPRVIGGAP